MPVVKVEPHSGKNHCPEPECPSFLDPLWDSLGLPTSCSSWASAWPKAF